MHTLKPFPNASEIEFKPAFIERYSKLTDWETFKRYNLSFLRRSLRVNTLKISVKELKGRLEKQGWKLEQVPWCREGFYAEHAGRRDLGNTIEHQLGYYYIQEAASMIPPLALGAQPGETILDMAAAPGSKTSQIAEMMKNTGIIVANEVSGERLAPLGSNLTRLGIVNVVTTQMKGQQFSRMRDSFDRILVDAPCSGSGTIRKSPKTIMMWNPRALKPLTNIQKELLMAAWNAVKQGGVIVYSTCSLEPEENEAVVSWFVEKTGALVEEFSLPLKRGKAITEFEGEKYNEAVRKTLRIWPQDNDTEGFFIAKIRKK